jgi:hypothetical protein
MVFASKYIKVGLTLSFLIASSCFISLVYTSKNLSSFKNDNDLIALGERAKDYKTVEELIPDSAVILVGEFEDSPKITASRLGSGKTVSASEDAKPQEMSAEDRAKLLSERVFGRRELVFRISEVIKGEVKDKVVSVAQNAIATENLTKPLEGDIFFEPGEKYILFLTPALPSEGQFYWLTGAVQGGFKVVNGKVRSRELKDRGSQEIGPQVREESLESFLKSIRSKVGSKSK